MDTDMSQRRLLSFQSHAFSCRHSRSPRHVSDLSAQNSSDLGTLTKSPRRVIDDLKSCRTPTRPFSRAGSLYESRDDNLESDVLLAPVLVFSAVSSFREFSTVARSVPHGRRRALTTEAILYCLKELPSLRCRLDLSLCGRLHGCCPGSRPRKATVSTSVSRRGNLNRPNYIINSA